MLNAEETLVDDASDKVFENFDFVPKKGRRDYKNVASENVSELMKQISDMHKRIASQSAVIESLAKAANHQQQLIVNELKTLRESQNLLNHKFEQVEGKVRLIESGQSTILEESKGE